MGLCPNGTLTVKRFPVRYDLVSTVKVVWVVGMFLTFRCDPDDHPYINTPQDKDAFISHLGYRELDCQLQDWVYQLSGLSPTALAMFMFIQHIY